jgi:hypothetical protein
MKSGSAGGSETKAGRPPRVASNWNPSPGASGSLSTGEEHCAGLPGFVSLPRSDCKPGCRTVESRACPAL